MSEEVQRIPQYLGNKAHPGGCTSLWTIAVDLQQALHWELKLEFSINPIQYKHIIMKAHVIPRVYHRLNSAALLREAASRIHKDILSKILISKREAADLNMTFYWLQMFIQNHHDSNRKNKCQGFHQWEQHQSHQPCSSKHWTAQTSLNEALVCRGSKEQFYITPVSVTCFHSMKQQT